MELVYIYTPSGEKSRNLFAVSMYIRTEGTLIIFNARIRTRLGRSDFPA